MFASRAKVNTWEKRESESAFELGVRNVGATRSIRRYQNITDEMRKCLRIFM